MKVLYIAGDVSLIGGIEKYNRDFLSSLDKAGVDTTLVERMPGGLFAKISFGLRVVLRALVERPDLIHCAHLHFAPVCLLLKNLLGIPYTLALYGIEIIDMQGSAKQQALLKAERIITISGYSRGLIVDRLPEVEGKIFMHPSAVDGDIFTIKPENTALRKKYGLEGRSVILSLARLATLEHKGQDRVLKALPAVLEKVPDAVYLIVGSGSDARVDAFLQQHPGLKERVIMVGAVSDEERVDFYNLADVYILPSKYEGFGIVFIESLACGVPVIASDGYGGREGLLNGALGLVVPPDDIESIADSLVLMLEKQAPANLFDRQELRTKTLGIYGIDAWDERVKLLVDELSSHADK